MKPSAKPKTLADCPAIVLAMVKSADSRVPLAIVHDPIGCADDTVPDWGFCPVSAVPQLHPHGRIVAIRDEDGDVKRASRYQPKTGVRCHCKRGVHRDNCPDCEGTGWRIDFAAIRTRTAHFRA